MLDIMLQVGKGAQRHFGNGKRGRDISRSIVMERNRTSATFIGHCKIS
jgi:hypothetical protein